jgi:hypothetical protein
MSKFKTWKATTAIYLSLSLAGGILLPQSGSVLNPRPAASQNTQNKSFSDVSSNYWAADFIAALVNRGIIAGFPDGTFKPDAPVTRAQFAAMVGKAFDKAQVRSESKFVDVPRDYWATSAIQEAYTKGFLAGYPGNIFRPTQNIPREQVLVSLANGLSYKVAGETLSILSYYNDNENISEFARTPIATATEKKMVVNYPSLTYLNPTRNATRAEVAAFIYQALVSQQEARSINSRYIVGQESNPRGDRALSRGTTIPVTYDREKILVTGDETVPLTLTVKNDIKNSNGVVVIPFGCKIIGQLEPASGGVKFVADRLELKNGKVIDINASSNVVTETETVRKGVKLGTLLKNAALGGAAAAAIAAITGDRAIATEEVLIGVGAGAVATLIPKFLGLDRINLISVKPNANLTVVLREDLVL